MPHPTLLVLEDDPDLSKILSASIDLIGYPHRCYRTLAQATESLNTLLPQIAIIDGRLPDGHGAQLIPLLKERAPHCVLILSSGAGDGEFPDIEDAFLLQKPYRIQELHRLLKAIADSLH